MFMKNLFRFLSVLVIGLGLFFLLLVKRHPDAGRENRREDIITLGYLTWVPAGETIGRKGVTRYLEDQFFRGFNLFNSRDQSSASLLDMQGREVHRWQAPVEIRGPWHHVEPCANGDLLVIIKDKALLRLDWNSRLKWIRRNRFHHDVAIGENGDIFAIVSQEKFVIHGRWPFPVVWDCIIRLSAAGNVMGKIPVYPLVADRIPEDHFQRIYRWLCDPRRQKGKEGRVQETSPLLPSGKPPDILHTNSLEIIGRDIAGLCRKNDFLISFRELDMIAILDAKAGQLRRTWGPGILMKQHHPVLLENANILVFDNGGRGRRFSRILELNPFTGEVVWEYRGKPPRSFFSVSRGGNQRLPNRNTLITESDRGRVFEVTPAGKIVWEFFNPRTDEREKTRAAIYRMIRLWDCGQYPFLMKCLSP